MQTLATAADLDAVLAADTALLFKNSMTCPISAAARREMQALLSRRPDAPLHVLDVHDASRLSVDVARRTGIEHESPQIILFARGEPVWHASHYSIQASEVERALDEAMQDGEGAARSADARPARSASRDAGFEARP
jgi:bacillithiol system protein YtxJ